MKKKSIAIIPPELDHESWTGSKETTFRHCIHFDWIPDYSLIKSPIAVHEGGRYNYNLHHPVPDEIKNHLPLIIHNVSNEVMEIMEKVLLKLRKEDVTTSAWLLWPVLKMLLTKSDYMDSRDEKKLYRGKSVRAIFTLKDYIEKHYREKISFTDFCELTKLSKCYLCEIFKETIGLPPTAYLNELRLQHSCRLLRSSNMNISETANAVGFDDPNYFTRLFRKKFNISPSEFIRS